MTKHKTGTRKEWLAARLELLKAEKDLTRRSDELAKKRQDLPWVKIEKEYRFETDEGKASLADLFRGRSQLLIYHFMFGPDYKAGCPSCSSIADGFNGIAIHLANHDVMFWAVSRAPLAQLQEYKKRMGWTFPWASSFGSDFNFDFDARSPKSNSARESNTTTGASRRRSHGAKRRSCRARPPMDRRNSRPRPGTDVDTYTRETAGRERVRARGWRRLSQLLRLFARSGQPLGDVSMARSRAQRPQRGWRALVETPR